MALLPHLKHADFSDQGPSLQFQSTTVTTGSSHLSDGDEFSPKTYGGEDLKSMQVVEIKLVILVPFLGYTISRF